MSTVPNQPDPARLDQTADRDPAGLDRLTGALAAALPGWLPEQRWFASKDRAVRSARVLTCTELTRTGPNHARPAAGRPRLLHLVVEVDSGLPAPDRYQLLVGVHAELPDWLTHGLITMVDGLALYEAVHDSDLTTVLLDLISRNATVGGIRFATLPGAELDASARSRPVGAEQSNTSLVYGHEYILKLFRRLQPGLSPDLELHRALHRVGCEYIAAPLGWFAAVLPPDPGSPGAGGDGAEPTTLGMLTEFLPNTADGWAMATTSVRDLMAEGDLHAHEVGGDFAAESHRLGHAVAAVHADLASSLGQTEAEPAQVAATVDGMHAKLDAVLASVPELAQHEAALRSVFEAAREVPSPVPLQRVHGDLHLGQTLRTPLHWVLIDFEGEPMVPISARRAPGSPLRDVAGMLRSFDYAAHQMVVGQHAGTDDPMAERQHAIRALEWARRNRSAFLDGYAEAGVPAGTELDRHAGLLRAFELDKAVYEVAYETGNRPDWMPIPLAAIERLVAEK